MADWLNLTFAQFDHSILAFFHELMVQYGKILNPLCKILAEIGDVPFLLLFWLGFALFFVKKDKRCGMLMCGSIIIGGILVTLVLKNIVYRPRPYLSDVTVYKEWWQYVGGKVDWDTSFPSGHSCAALAGVLSWFLWSDRKGLKFLAFLYPLVMGISRVCLVVHYPSDVIAGYVIGVIAVLVCLPIVDLFYKLFEKYPDLFLSRFVLTGSFKKNGQLSE